MRILSILVLLVVVALTLGCVGQKKSESPGTSVPPGTPASSGGIEELDELGIESDLEQLDSMFNDTSMDVSFEVNDPFT